MAFGKGIATMAAALGLLFVASGAPLARARVADRATYVCHFASQTGWISPVVLVEMSGAEIKVADLPLLQLKGQAVTGRIVVDNSVRRTFAWEMKDVRGSRRQYANSLNYRMSVRKDDHSAMITMTPLGYANIFRETGSCTVRAGGLLEQLPRDGKTGNLSP